MTRRRLIDIAIGVGISAVLLLIGVVVLWSHPRIAASLLAAVPSIVWPLHSWWMDDLGRWARRQGLSLYQQGVRLSKSKKVPVYITEFLTKGAFMSVATPATLNLTPLENDAETLAIAAINRLIATEVVPKLPSYIQPFVPVVETEAENVGETLLNQLIQSKVAAALQSVAAKHPQIAADVEAAIADLPNILGAQSSSPTPTPPATPAAAA